MSKKTLKKTILVKIWPKTKSYQWLNKPEKNSCQLCHLTAGQMP